MNGINGIIEPMKTDTTEPSIPCKETADTETSNHSENSNDTGSHHLDNDSSQEPLELSNGKINENINSNEHGITLDDDTIVEISDGKNHTSDSNGSCPDKNPKSEEISEKNDYEKVGDCEIQVIYTIPGNNEDTEEEVDSEQDSTDEEMETQIQPLGDTVSINSDSDSEVLDDSSQETNNKNSEVIIIDTNNEPEGDSAGSEIQEIVSDHENDDCIVTKQETKEKASKKEGSQLRRSSRAIKKKTYSDDDINGTDDSDIEEIQIQDPLRPKAKPIIINNTKALIEIASKQKYHANNQKKEPTVVIIDSKSGKNKNSVSQNSNNNNSHNLCQTIVSRGTTVTSVSVKSSNSTQGGVQAAQPSILPSLTDDMFVVEAPSFIVPYVYEKPSVIPFREFVDIMGKELDAIKAKAEQEQVEKEKDEKKKKEKEKQDRRDRGEVIDTDEESKTEEIEESEENKKRKKAEKKERRQRRRDDDDASWDGESSDSSEDDLLSDEEKTVIIKNKIDVLDNTTDIAKLNLDKVVSKTDNYFDCSLGKFFIDIGLNLVQGHVQNDLLKQQNRKLQREKKSGHSSKATAQSIASLSKNLEFSKKANEPYSFPQKKCEHCSFKSESQFAMAHHLETPHMKNNVYKCNFCSFEIKSPHDILYHMESEHKSRGRLERAPAYHQCANCPFEDNGKGKLARHLIPCAKKFKPEMNQAPPLDWEPPAKIPKMTRSRNMMGTYQSAFQRAPSNINRPPMTMSNVLGVGGYRPRGKSPMTPPIRGTAIQSGTVARNALVRSSKAVPVLLPCYTTNNNKSAPKSTHQPSISITPLPRQPAPQVQPQQSKSSFVICEICDGYIKDLEQLRNHMQWIHKVKIHPKMIYNRPPLNCQKCQFRFFTDQGLERHLLGSHGLVTSSMQEAANKGKDAGRCPVCGRVYQWKLLNHVGRDHNLTLKPAHLSYKCTVCTATFGMYKQFENHVYSAHSVVAKRVMDKNKAPVKSNESLLKPLKINDEITIIPQPNKSEAAAVKEK